MKKLLATLIILTGIALVSLAVYRATADFIKALNATPTPVLEEVLETFAPDTGPLGARTSTPAAQALQSTPTELAALQTAPATLPAPLRPTLPVEAAQTAESALSPQLPEYTGLGSGVAEQLEGPYLGERVDPASAQTARPTEGVPAIPERIIIPAIQLDAPVVLAASQKVRVRGEIYYQWLSPEKAAAGWHTNSAYLGETGNTVLNGHHNMFGKVFGKLVDLNPGDAVEVRSGERSFHYRIVNKLILPERDAPIAERLENARWILPSEDERLTLITCWPATSNTHRLVIVAVPDPDFEVSTSP